MAFWTDKQNIIEPLRPYRFLIQETDSSEVWWWAKSASKPSFEISQDEYQLINHKIKYPGIATWKDVSIKIIDYKNDGSGDKTKSFTFYKYLKSSGYVLSTGDGISKTKAIKNFIIEQLDADGNKLETWKLINAFIKNVEFSELSYDTETLSEITLTIAYDLAELT